MISDLPDFICKKLVGLSGPISAIFYSISFILFIGLSAYQASAQTDFAPGEIMFTGYNSDDPDGFSIVILADVVAGTTIYITDRGWSSTTGFRDDIDGGEGTISFTFTEAYTCGTTLVFEDVGGTNDWTAEDANGNSVGTVVILTSTTESPIQDADGIELNGGFPDGDQLFIYQLPEPNPGNQSGFVTGIHMNGGAWNGGNGDDQSSQKPSGLANNQVVRFNTEVDNAKYNCSIISGSATELQAAIENDNGSGGLIADNINNWTESNTYINLFPTCSFCCGTVPATPVLSSVNEVLTNQVFTITVIGTLAPGESWELYTAGCGVGSPLQTTMSNSFTVTAPGTAGSITYYVRSSEDLTCPATCASINVCVVTDLYSTCTVCNASLTTCGPCFLPSPVTNPPLDSGCYQTRLIFVLDESGSIGGNAQDVEDGVLAFLNTLNGQDIEAALIEFSALGTLVNNYTTINDAYITNVSNYFNGIPYNGQTYSPNGGTNWHDAMIDVDALDPADIVLFFTDGEPTGWTNNGNVDYCGDGGSTQTPEIVNPVKLANKIKSEGTHMFMLGVGGGIVELNLQRMSGFVEYQPGVNTIGTSDYSIGEFATLAEDLEEFVEELCRTTIEISKTILGPVCNGVVDFMFIVKNTGNESSTLGVTVSDTFPSGYTNITYNGPPGFKLCPFLNPCIPAQPPNAFVWLIFPIPPQGSDTLILSATVLPTGNYTNIAWAQTDNAASIVSDTFPGSTLTYDQPPTITCPANVTIQCGASTLPSNTGNASANDPDSPPAPIISYEDVTVDGTCPIAYTITRTWKAEDVCGHIVTCTQSIVLVDETPPSIQCPVNITVDCVSDTSPNMTGTAMANDACDANPLVSFADVTVAGSCPADYTIQRTWTATDECGNSTTCIQTISVEDNTPPSITCTDTQILCEVLPSPENTGYPFVTNDCGGSSVFAYSDVFVYSPCAIIRTWTATDNCGNSSTCTQYIAVKDLNIPTITCPANVTIGCSANTLPSNTGSATATDNCAINPTIAYTDVIETSPLCPQNKTITRSWTATDECGNTATCTQTITVMDNLSPMITCPVNVTIACNASTLPANTGQSTAVDNCDPSVVITYADVTIAGTCPQEYTITRTWNAVDDCGNSSTCTQTIVIDDSVSPTIACPTDVTIQCTASTLPENTGIATSLDNCDSAPEVTFTNITINGSCPQQFVIQRIWQSTDACGNSSTCMQTISVIDNTNPTIACPANITIACSASTLPSETGQATGSDNCSASPTITYMDATAGGACPQEYTITRTWKVTDACGNSTTCNQTIVVDDALAPVITCPANVTIQCTASTLPANTGNASASDNCDASAAITYTDVTSAGSCSQAYTITRTWKATDDCTNSSTCAQTITVIDNIGPVLSCAPDITIECTASTLPANTGLMTAIDNCDLSPEVTYLDATVSGSCTQEYTINRTWTATDECGNSTTCLQVITIDDSTAPTFSCPANITIQCTENTLPVNTGSPTQLTDNCDPAPVMSSSDVTIAGACASSYSITRTWTAEDACGNTGTCNQIITIQDTTPPSITCPDNITIECTEVTLPENTGTAVTTDNCDLTPDLDFNDVTMEGPTPNGYTINRTWTSTDACNNSSTCLQTIIVENPVNPEITGSTIDTICSGSSVMFIAEDQGLNNTTYQWMFGSGASPSSAMGIGPHTVTYTYNASNGSVGAHVLLTVTVEGCSAVTDTVANVHVNGIPNPAINASTANLCYFKLRTFKPVAPEMPGFEYHWNFGAGASIPMITGYGPHEVEYSTTGVKTVQLIVEANEAGASCSDTATITFNVINCPGNVTGRVRKPDGVGIGGVNLRLFNDANLDGISDGGPPLRSVFTTAAGVYSMVGLVPGQYVIVETDLPGYFSLYDEDETNDFDTIVFSDPNDNVIPVTLEAQEIDADNVFVDVTNPGTITGYVFEDFDIDGMPDAGEGIPGVMVQLYPDADQNGVPDPGSPLATTTSSGIGWYTFGDLANGDYVIIETQPSGYNNVQDIDLTNDGDVVPNTNMTDDIIPVTITSAETDAHNFFKESNICSNTVTNANDGGAGSFRYALNCSSSEDTIFFSANLAGQVIHLTSDRIVVDKNIYVHSTLTPRIGFQSDIAGAFLINSGVNAEFKNITFTSGLSGHLGAAFENYGNLILWDTHVLRNSLLLPGNFLIYNGAAGLFTAKGDLQIEID